MHQEDLAPERPFGASGSGSILAGNARSGRTDVSDFASDLKESGLQASNLPVRKVTSVRCFAAVEVSSPAVRRVLEEAREEMRRALGADAGSVKWVRPDQFHFTLRFFGELGPAEVSQAALALRRAAAETAPFRLAVAGLGAFPSLRNPRVLWAGTAEGREQLVALARRLEEELAGVGFARETRPFRPHLTLGRVRQGADVAAPLRDLLSRPPSHYGAWQVERVVLMRSELLPAGPRYTVVEAAELVRGE